MSCPHALVVRFITKRPKPLQARRQQSHPPRGLSRAGRHSPPCSAGRPGARSGQHRDHTADRRRQEHRTRLTPRKTRAPAAPPRAAHPVPAEVEAQDQRPLTQRHGSPPGPSPNSQPERGPTAGSKATLLKPAPNSSSLPSNAKSRPQPSKERTESLRTRAKDGPNDTKLHTPS